MIYKIKKIYKYKLNQYSLLGDHKDIVYTKFYKTLGELSDDLGVARGTASRALKGGFNPIGKHSNLSETFKITKGSFKLEDLQNHPRIRIKSDVVDMLGDL